MKLISFICANCILADQRLCREQALINRLEKVRSILSTEYTDAFDLLAGMASCPHKKVFDHKGVTDG